MAFNTCEPSESFLLAMRARCSESALTRKDGPVDGADQPLATGAAPSAIPAKSHLGPICDAAAPTFRMSAGPSYAVGAASSSRAVPDLRPASSHDGGSAAFKISGAPSFTVGASAAGARVMQSQTDWHGPPNFNPSCDVSNSPGGRFQVGPGPALHASLDLGQHNDYSDSQRPTDAMSLSLDLSRVGESASRSGSQASKPMQGQQQVLHNKTSELRRPRPGPGPSNVPTAARPSGGARSSSRGPKLQRADPEQGSRRRSASSNGISGGQTSGRAASIDAEMPAPRSKGSRPSSSGRPPMPTEGASARLADGASARPATSDTGSARLGSDFEAAALGSDFEAAAGVFDEAQSVGEESAMYSVLERDTETVKIPSVVTLAGVPVATDGDLVYLGGGIYAAAAPAQPPKQPAPASHPKSKLLPGRVRAPLPRPAAGGHSRSAVRSASAHSMAHRGRSDSELGFLETGSTGTDDIFGDAPDKGKGAAEASQAAPAWRPAGAARLPKPADVSHTRPLKLTLEAQSELGPPGVHSEARASERRSRRRDDMNLFGRHGMLQELASMQEQQQQPSYGPPRVAGAPLNSDMRAAERKAAKEARVTAILEERAERLAHEKAQKAAQNAMNRSSRGSVSAPALPDAQLAFDEELGTSADDIARQKLRVACKMEILDFFNGYHNAVGKMTAEQTRMLLAKLHGGSEGSGLAEAVQHCEQEREAQAHEWSEAAQQVEDPHSIHRRLQQVNNFCNQVFDSSSAEGSGVSMMQGF